MIYLVTAVRNPGETTKHIIKKPTVVDATYIWVNRVKYCVNCSLGGCSWTMLDAYYISFVLCIIIAQ
jgi:hypothetical protein